MVTKKGYKKTKVKNPKIVQVKTAEIKKTKKFVPIVICAIVLVLLVALLVVNLTKAKVADGDNVTLDYTGYLDNGTVFDTSLHDVGMKSNLNRVSYEPFTFVAGQGQVIPGFDKAVLGMQVAEKKTFTLTPEEGYGEVKDELFVKGLKRDLNVTRYSIINLSLYFNLFGGEPKVGTMLTRQEIPWKLQVVEIDNGSVKIENLLTVGQKVNISGVQWESVVTNVDNKFVTVRQNPKLGDGIAFPTANGMLVGFISGITDDTFDVNANSPLAGKSLTFEIIVKNIAKKAK